MVAVKPLDADAFIAKPDAARPVVLIYGPDSGLVRERAEALIRTSVDDPRDPFALAHLEGDALASEPGRLSEEANTVPLFGGRRAVWVKAGSRNFAPAVEALLASPPKDCRVVIEAGDLRKSSPLLAACIKSRAAAAVPCYIDGERELARLVDTEMRAAGLSIAPEARAALVSLIGGDRRASRSEIRKLALYAHGQSGVGLDDVLAVVADASALALDAVVDAALAGQPGDVETQFAKAASAGTPPGTVVAAALRHVLQLHKARLGVEAGEPTETALYGFVPPIHFRRKPQVEAALSAFTSARLAGFIEQLAEASFNIRRTPALADSIGQRTLLSIAVAARRKGR